MWPVGNLRFIRQIAWHGSERRLESCQCADVAVTGSLFGNAKHLGGFSVGELFELSLGEDFAVNLFHVGQRFI